jgi:hypothetical protein
MSSNTTTTAIKVAYPDANGLNLKIGLGACRLKVTPGDGGEWVSGTYHDPHGALPPRIEQDGGTARIMQDYHVADFFNLINGAPKIDLALGKARPYPLTVEVGASESKFDLGGLPLTQMTVKQGAGKCEFDFSTPNPQPMSLLTVDAGAMSLEMKNLANANFAEMSISGGAAAYKFDFGGTLQRDAHVKITTGMSSVEVIVPANTAVKIATESAMGSLNVGDGFTKKAGAFWTEAAVKGQTPVLTIDASVSLGSLMIRTA